MAPRLKKIFMTYLPVGDYLFSTVGLDEEVKLETTELFFGFKWTLVI